MASMDDVIFFWESGSEPPQIIDQHLGCLRNAGFLDRVRGMIVGDVSYNEEPRKDRPLDELLADIADELAIPVVRIPTFGHHPLENPAVPIGARARIDTAAREVALLEPVVDAA